MNQRNTKIRIGQIVDKFLPVTESWIYSQIKGLEKLGVESKVFCHKIINTNSYHHKPIYSYKNLSSLRRNFYKLKALATKEDAATLYWNEIIKKEKPDLVHSHFGWAAKKGIDIAITLHLPHLVTFYGADVTRDPFSKTPEHLNYQKKLPIIFNKSKVILCTSHFLKRCLIELGAPKEKVRVWRLGVDLSLFKRQESRKKEGKFRIISIGRFIDWKGQKILIRALSEIIKAFPDTEVVFIGEGPTLMECKQLAKKLKISQYASFKGKLKHEEVAEVLAQSDVLVQASFTAEDGNNESLGMTLVEAGACGLALVASNSGGMPEIVIDKKTGLLFEEKNSEQLAEKIIQLMKDKNLREQLGHNAKEHIQNTFDLKRQTKELKDIYEEILAYKI